MYEYEAVAGCGFVKSDSVWRYEYTYAGVETFVVYEWEDDSTVSYLKDYKKSFLPESPTIKKGVDRQEMFEEAMDNCIYYKTR